MATSAPIEQWTTREKLCLASSVMRSGDQNWVSVSRAIKPFIEPNRPPDWFSQKNCAIQYSAMLEAVDTPKRKRSGEKGEVETPVDLIVRRMTQERIEEIKHQLAEEKKRFKQLQDEIDAIQSGQLDDQLPAMWAEIQAKKKEEEEAAESRRLAAEALKAAAAAKPQKTVLQPPGKRRPPIRTPKAPPKQQAPPTSQPPASGESLPETEPIISVESPEPVTVVVSGAEAEPVATGLDDDQSQRALLSSLLSGEEERKAKSGKETLDAEEAVTIEAFPHIFTDSTTTTPTKDTAAAAGDKQKTPTTPVAKLKESSTSQDPDALDALVEETIDEEREDIVLEEKTEEVKESDSPAIQEENEPQEVTEKSTMVTENEELPLKPDVEVHKPDVEVRKPEPAGGKLLRTPSHEPVDVMLEPASPTVPAKQEVKKRGRGRPSNLQRKSARAKAKQDEEEEGDAKLHLDDIASVDDSKDETRSDAADSEDHDRPSEGDDTSLALPTSMFGDSLPNSPSSVSHSEEDHAYRIWRKAIMLVWRSAASHKYANVFLHPVTDDIAPGYRSIVHRPMDLISIKKNIENGTIRTTEAFHRNILLMFQNAIMYNSSDHDVYQIAVSMQNDVINLIEEFISTQLMVQQPDSSKVLRGRESGARRSEIGVKEDEGKTRRSSTDHQETSGKKRRTRADEY